MKKQLVRAAVFFAAILISFNASLQAQPGPPFTEIRHNPVALTISLSSEIKPLPVLAAMQRVADWQLANPATDATSGWIQAAGEAGFMALAGISGDAKYRDAMRAMGDANDWKPGPRKYHADDQCVGQTYAELYFLFRDPKMIAPLRERFDSILASPPPTASLDFLQPGHGQELWSWCDSLFMAPPSWVRLTAATGDEKYLDFALTNWWRTTDFLYDTNEHLFFRDSTFFKKTEANGKKVFWARGNGWVMGGIVRILQYLPMNHPDRPRFEKLFKEMAEKILTCQQPDGLWRASLLDPESYPLKETSGSGFYAYALAWGVNQGLLDRAQFEPAVGKAWTALVACVEADGKLIHVQPVGSDPRKFADDSTAPYGVGAFLLAGSEVYRMAAMNPETKYGTPKPLEVKVVNPANFWRETETIALDVTEIEIKEIGLNQRAMPVHLVVSNDFAVMDGVSSRILGSQVYSPEPGKKEILFQVDLAPDETRTFYILDGATLAAVPLPIVKTLARYVPERHDDFAWESDRIAHRMYGPALETWQAEPLTSSGIDVWVKRKRNLVINNMYGTMKLFDTNGPAQDDYKVGKTRGDGGLGIWKDGKLYVSKNWRTCKIITTGPIRSEFELTYDAWDAGGRKISETKRISIDAGSNLSRVESTFNSDDKSPLQIGVGLAERPGENTVLPINLMIAGTIIHNWTNSVAEGLFVQDKKHSFMTYWQPQDFAKGTTAVAFILPKGSVQIFTNDNPNLPASAFAAPAHTLGEGQPAIRNQLAIAPAKIGKPFVYYFGAGWSESGDFPNAAAWNGYIIHFFSSLQHPLQVTVGN